ncbi:DUF2079 domain-containing protein [candidate division KSB1 bacterium]|nr:DUF2079 domain-containing protein [candidate division KSB1 bacterium]
MADSRRYLRDIGSNFSREYMVVLIMCIVYTLAIGIISIMRYESFSANVYDLGIMIQVVWNTSKGWILQDSVNMGRPMMRFWMAHWEFIYIVIALFYKIISTPYTILFFQTIVVASGAIPIYWLARDKFGHGALSVIFPISYLLYPAMQNANLEDIHGVTLAAPFLLFAFYYLQKKRIAPFIIFGLIALTCREDSALLLFMMGIYAFLFNKQRKLGIGIALFSIAWFLLWYKRMWLRAMLGLPEFVIMEGAETHWDHLAQIKYDALYLVKFLAKKYNIRYFLYLFGPVLFLSLFSLRTLLIAAPMFAINLLSSYYYTHEVEHHYSATIVPFIFISAIFGLDHLVRSAKIKMSKVHQNKVSLALLIAALLFFFLKSNVFDLPQWKILDHHRVLKEIIETIPEEASLSAETKLAVHAAERHELYSFNDNVDRVDYILYDFYAPTINLITRKSFQLPYLWPDNDYIRDVLHDENYGIERYEDGVCLLKRGADHVQGLKKLIHADVAEIEKSSYKMINDHVELRGYRTHDILTHYVQPDKLGEIYWKHAVHLTCFYELKSLPKDNVDMDKVKVQVRNDAYAVSFEHEPFFNCFNFNQLDTGKLLRDEVFWEIPDDAPHGFYQFCMSITAEHEPENYVYLFDFYID